jgi:NAD(P)-dependent dehydrogenase (short-subunit alcohol dehydrogenase family)
VGVEGKVAVVTGGGTGIGRGVAGCLVEAGASVVVAGRREAPLRACVAELAAAGTISAQPCDVTDVASVHALIDAVIERHGTLDILCCSHGVLHAGHTLVDYPVELFDESVAVNLRGTFLCGQAAARAMIERGVQGRIINISSIVAVASVPREVGYDTSKAGVEALTRAMCLDLAPHAITVNSVAPGWIRTEMVEAMLAGADEGSSNPLRRYGTPAEVGSAVLWLADPSSAHVTGATIFMDGGQRAALSGGPPSP